jgi:ankyrin repeat protein
MDFGDLPNDVDTLKVLVSDLNRRLQNAQGMAEMQKRIALECLNSNKSLRRELSETVRILTLERAKNDTLLKKKVLQQEAIRYDNIKSSTDRAHEELRDELIDNKIKAEYRETKKIKGMRAKLEKMENVQDSQKLLLQHLNHAEKSVEDLALAAQHGDVETCSRIVRSGVSVNDPDSAGFLPLHYACLTGSEVTATYLLEQGSDVTSYLTGMSPMEIAAKNGHSNLIAALYKYGADVNDGGAGGSPPIVSATGGNHYSCVEALVRLGANVNSQDLQGLTALHMSSRLEKPKPFVEFLLANGADKLISNRAGQNPLQLALSVMNMQAIEALGKSSAESISAEDRIKSSGAASPRPALGASSKTSHGLSAQMQQNSIFSAITTDSGAI